MTFYKTNLTDSKMISGVRFLARLMLLFTAGILYCQASYAVSLDDITYSALPGDKVQINLKFSQPLAAKPVNFTIDNPARIAIDLPNVDLKAKNKDQNIGVGMAHSIVAVEAAGRTRVVVNLVRLVPYDMKLDGNRLLVTLDSAGASSASPQMAESAVSKFSSGNSNTAHSIKNIDFRRGADGSGRIIVTLSDPGIGINMGEQGGQIVVDFISTNLPSSLDRRLDVTDFATPVKDIDTSANASGVHMAISTTTDQYDHLAYQSDDVFTIEVKPLTAQEQEAQKKEKFGYTGQKLSLNFQNIEVRAVLSLLADFTGNNLVATDTVGGNVTLRLRNVPWDQALDIILKAKGLGMRKQGNVMLVAPQAELAAREKLDLESAKQKEDLEPLRTEFIQINYAKAADLAKLIKSGGENSLLSKRGNVSIDQRTNTLIVQDVSTSLTAIRSMIAKLDVPIRQVMIESRIVNADESFTKDLGVRFGISKSTSGGTPSTSSYFVNAGGTNTGGIGDPGGTTAFAAGSGEGLMVNLPVPGATSTIGLLAGKVGTFLLQLELSALLSEGRGQDLANPKVITADQKEAVIESGVEIPYQEASSSGATSTSFKKAVLSLSVTPQITPDNRIMLDLKVSQDTQGTVVSGIPTINTRNVTTNVLVDDGETVVLGGIYQQRDSDTVDRTPFFSDLPALGFLFRKHRTEKARQELLIFVTPRILKSNMKI